MSLRKQYGGVLEGILNGLVDKYLDGAFIKAKAHEYIDKLVDEKLEGLKEKLKADVIDKLDGEDDVK